MKSRIEYFGNNPVRYITDANGLEYVCIQDLRDACNPLDLMSPISDSMN